MNRLSSRARLVTAVWQDRTEDRVEERGKVDSAAVVGVKMLRRRGWTKEGGIAGGDGSPERMRKRALRAMLIVRGARCEVLDGGRHNGGLTGRVESGVACGGR